MRSNIVEVEQGAVVETLYTMEEALEYAKEYVSTCRRKEILNRQRKRAEIRYRLGCIVTSLGCMVAPVAVFSITGVTELLTIYLVTVPLAICYAREAL